MNSKRPPILNLIQPSADLILTDQVSVTGNQSKPVTLQIEGLCKQTGLKIAEPILR